MPDYRALRDRLFAEQKGRCFYCRCHMVPAGADDDRATTLDHVTPKSKGGRARIEDAVCACRKCNHAKADKPVHEFLKRTRPGRPLHKRVLPRPDAELSKYRQARKAKARWQLGAPK